MVRHAVQCNFHTEPQVCVSQRCNATSTRYPIHQRDIKSRPIGGWQFTLLLVGGPSYRMVPPRTGSTACLQPRYFHNGIVGLEARRDKLVAVDKHRKPGGLGPPPKPSAKPWCRPCGPRCGPRSALKLTAEPTDRRVSSLAFHCSRLVLSF
jgi:hypothetical protein